MVAQSPGGHEWIKSGDAAARISSAGAALAVYADTKELVERQRVEAERLKAGKPSGITDQFGKLHVTGLEDLNPQQQAAADLAGRLLWTKFSVGLLNPGLEDVRESLYGKTEAQIQVADAFFKNHTGQSLEEAFRAKFKGAELDQALDMLKHKDKDLLPLPEGVDRTKLLYANSLIVLAPDVNASNTTEDRPASYQRKIDPKSLHDIFEGKTAVELQAMNALFKDCHGITLEEYLQKNAFVPLGSLDKYAKEANDAKAAKENFEGEVKKVDQAKIAEAAKIIHDSTGALEKLALLKIPAWDLPHLGDYPAQKAIQNFTPAEMEALKRHYKGAYGEDVKERVKDVPFFGESLQRTLDRPPYSAMDRIPVEKQAALREDTKKLFATMEYANGTDEKGYYRLLEGKTPAERAAMIEYYQELTGDSLERRTIDEFKEDAAELEKALNYLRIGSEVESANLHLALTENNAAHAMERVSTMTPAQLLQADQEIKEHYGKTLREVIQTNEEMTQAAKDALLIFVDSASRQPDANGRRMTDDEWAKVMELSLTAKKVEQHLWGVSAQGPGDLSLFQNVMSAAPPDVRERFLNAGGEDKIEIAFLGDGDNIDDAKNYARFGKLSVERKIDKCDHIDDDEPGIRKSLDTMDQQERDSYLRGARIVKENILDKLPDEQKALAKAQLNGELGSLVLAQFDTSSLTAQELKDYEKFKSVNAAIDRPADDEEHWEWRDRAVYSGGVDKAKEFVEHLPWEKLQAIKASEARENFFKENNFDLLSDHARKQIDDLLDKQKLAEKPEDLKYADGKALEDVVKLYEPTYTAYEPKEAQKIVDGIVQMPLAGQQKYRQDSEYRQQVDERVKTVLHGPQQEAALHMLESVAKGGYPVADWIDNINIEAAKNETSEPQVIRYVEEEFRKDHERVEQLKREGKPVELPELRERLSNPQTAEDLALKDRLDRALHSGLDGDEYETWAKPVLQNGRLTFEQKIQLDKEKGNKEDVYKDVAALATAPDPASIEERHRLAADANYRQQVLGHLPAEERELAEKIIKQSAILPAEISNSLAHVKPEERKYILDKLNTDEAYRQQLLPGLSERDQRQAIRVLELGAVLPEDAARAYKIGAQSSTEEMMSTLRAMDKNSAQENDFKAAYADAFHKDIADDLASKLEGKDKTEMERLLRDNPKTARELYFRTVEEAESENRGAAAALTKVWGSQAGDLAEDSARQMYVKLTQAAESGKELSVDDKELQQLAKDATEYTDIFAETKQASVDAVVGIALSVATIAVPGGLSLKLLYWTVGGGIGKVAMKAALLGDEYDGRVMKDFVSGAVDTACSAVGGAQIAKVLRLGSKVGAQATKDLLEAGVVKPLLKDGEQVLQKTLQRAVAEEIAHGSGMISDHAITDIVSKVAKEGATDAEKAILQESIKTSLTNAIKTEVREGARQFVHEAGQFALRKGLDAASGYVGGFAGGFSGALFEWDSSKSWHENLGQALDAGLQAGKGGLVGGAAFSTGFSVLGTVARGAKEGAGHVWHMIRAKDVPGPMHLSNPEEIASAGYFAVVRSKDAPHPSPKDRGIKVTPDAMKSLLPVGKTDYFIGEGGVLLKKVEDLPNGNAKLVPDEHAALVARREVAEKIEQADASRRLESPTGSSANPSELRRLEFAKRTRDLIQAGRTDGIPIHGLENAEVLIDNQKVQLKDGQIVIGRAHTATDGATVGDMRVSGEHGTLRWDEQQRSFYFSDKSTYGTWVKREGAADFDRLVSNREVKIGPRDEVRLGSPDGPELRLVGTPGARAQAAMQRVDQRVFLGERLLDLTPGKPVTVGRGDVSFGSRDIIDAKVSKNHGTLGLDHEGRLVYTDHSSNGTFVRRAGSDKFAVLKEGQTTYINPADEVRLGSEFGPELKHSVAHGQALTDGSVLFRRAGEDVYRRPDGLVQVSDSTGAVRVEDRSGKVMWVRGGSSIERSYSYLPDGRLAKIENHPNGSVFEFKEGAGWTIKHPGNEPAPWSGDIEVNPDGSLTYGDGVRAPWRERLDGTAEILHPTGRIEYVGATYHIQRAKLDALADVHFQDPRQRNRFANMMAGFEARARSIGLPEQEVASTYLHLNRLIQAGDGAPIGARDRLRLAEQILGQVEFPPRIDQGAKNTCNVTTVENRIVTRQPSEAARLITDVATTGRYVTADGAIVDLGRVPGGIKPDYEASMSLNRTFDGTSNLDLQVDGMRTYASQIFQNTAVNVKYAGHGPHDVVVTYEVHPSTAPGDTGERLFSYVGNPDGSLSRHVLKDHPHTYTHELTDIHNRITGGGDAGFVLSGHQSYRTRRGDNVVYLKSARKFESYLRRVQDVERQTGVKQFPLILGVDSGRPPFQHLLGGGTGGYHFVNIQGILDRNGTMYVELSNQWGSKGNRLGHDALPVAKLFEATQSKPRRGPHVDAAPTHLSAGGVTGKGSTPAGPDALVTHIDLSKKAVHGSREFDVVGFDSLSGAALLSNPRYKPVRSVPASRAFTEADFASGKFKEMHVGGAKYYRDLEGKVYTLDENRARLNLHGDLTAAPRNRFRLRSEPLDAQRPLTREQLQELNPGHKIETGEHYRVRSSNGTVEEGWKLEGTASDGRLILTRAGALRLQEISSLERLESGLAPAERSPVRPGELDPEQMALRDANFGLDFKHHEGTGEHDMWIGQVELPGGSRKEVTFHKIWDYVGYGAGEGADSARRLRKEMAAYQLNQMFEFDNGFPVTAPREIIVDGKLQSGWIQDKSGQSFETRIRELAEQRFGSSSDDAVSRLVKEDQELRNQVEQAFAERLIYGDSDNHAGNLVIVETPAGLKVQSIDLDYAFTSRPEPVWYGGREFTGINARLHADFSGQPLSEATLGKIQRFVEKYDTPSGRQQLAHIGLEPEEIDGLLSRARWLADRRHFPKAYGAR